ncbi:hypothetical protein PV08_02560 [Exophiala spinifera]|uniref:Early meiotic induction protein 1 n=1 Tax=Exophiala spinifera TaxID=91928 RepID=A0A0D1ZZW1_9EURO|nr:uncharacterized protein PV08_02560 [Exophiala spinifera]KIW18272.1 hypothetical protein PV08_02560 [Exophiala spinifera]
MDWFWRSKSPKAHEASEPNSSSLSQASASIAAPALPSVAEPVKSALSREEQANQEFLELVRELQAQTEPTSEKSLEGTKSARSVHTTPVEVDISPDSLYPTEISCRSSFDYAMFCQSFGGQFVNIYRYGSFRSCSNHWDDFWLCMRTRNWDAKDRAAAIQDHYRKKAMKWRTGPSSEDVWDVRTEPVKDAFQGNLDELEAAIAAWKKANPTALDPWERPQPPAFNSQTTG